MGRLISLQIRLSGLGETKEERHEFQAHHRFRSPETTCWHMLAQQVRTVAMTTEVLASVQVLPGTQLVMQLFPACAY